MTATDEIRFFMDLVEKAGKDGDEARDKIKGKHHKPKKGTKLTDQDKKEGKYIDDNGEKVDKEGIYDFDQNGDGIPDYLKPNNEKTFQLYKDVLDNKKEEPRKERKPGDRAKVVFDKGKKKGETYYFKTVNGAHAYGMKFRDKLGDSNSGTAPQIIKLVGSNKGVDLRKDTGKAENELEWEYNGKFESVLREGMEFKQAGNKPSDDPNYDSKKIYHLYIDGKHDTDFSIERYTSKQTPPISSQPDKWWVRRRGGGNLEAGSETEARLKAVMLMRQPIGEVFGNGEFNLGDGKPALLDMDVARRETPEKKAGRIAGSAWGNGEPRIWLSSDGNINDARGPFSPGEFVRWEDGTDELLARHGFSESEMKEFVAERITRDEEGGLDNPEWTDQEHDLHARNGHEGWAMFSREADVLLKDALKQVLEMGLDSPEEAYFAMRAKAYDLHEIGLGEIDDTAVTDKYAEEICKAYGAHNSIGRVSSAVSKFKGSEFPSLRMYTFAGENELRRIFSTAVGWDKERPAFLDKLEDALDWAVHECEQASEKYPEAADKVVLDNMRAKIREYYQKPKDEPEPPPIVDDEADIEMDEAEMRDYISERIMLDSEGHFDNPEWSDKERARHVRNGHETWAMFSREANVLLKDAFKQTLEMRLSSPEEALFAFQAKIRDLQEIGLAEITDTDVREMCAEKICDAYGVHGKISEVMTAVEEFKRPGSYPSFRMYTFAGENAMRRIWMSVREVDDDSNAIESAIKECEEIAGEFPEAKSKIVLDNMREQVKDRMRWRKDKENGGLEKIEGDDMEIEMDENLMPTKEDIASMISESSVRAG